MEKLPNKYEQLRRIKELQNLIIMKCLDCVRYQAIEAIKCNLVQCPLWQERPKKREMYPLGRLKKEKANNEANVCQ